MKEFNFGKEEGEEGEEAEEEEEEEEEDSGVSDSKGKGNNGEEKGCPYEEDLKKVEEVKIIVNNYIPKSEKRSTSAEEEEEEEEEGEGEEGGDGGGRREEYHYHIIVSLIRTGKVYDFIKTNKEYKLLPLIGIAVQSNLTKVESDGNLFCSLPVSDTKTGFCAEVPISFFYFPFFFRVN